MTENEKKAIIWISSIRDDMVIIEEHIDTEPLSSIKSSIKIREAKDLSVLIIEKALKELDEYREIGTVEECRVAVERQGAKKVNNRKILTDFNKITYAVRGNCPNCGSDGLLSVNTDYCNVCGQHLNWERDIE